MKLHRLIKQDRTPEGDPVPGTETLLGYLIACPGCGAHHAIYTEVVNRLNARWSFNGDLEKPTFSPSIKSTWTQGENHIPQICHFFVRNGKIEYCEDCTHDLRGKTVPMIEMEC